MNKKTLKLPLLLALTLALLAVTVPFAFAGDDDAGMKEMQEQGADQMGQMDQKPDMKAMHEQMMQRHQQMLDEMKQSQAKLDSLVEQMKSAQGDAKVDAVAAVLEELVAQHQKNMAQRMEMMEGMGGMMGHDMPGMHHDGMMAKGHGGHCASCPKGDDCPMKDGMKGDCHCPNCPMKDGMKGDCPCPHCPMKDGMKGECPKCENCPMHKEMKKDTMEEGGDMSSEGR